MANEKLYIDIFAGCGGLSTGLLNAGWTGLFAIEKNADAFATLKYNLIDNKEHFRWPKWLPVKECDINVLLKDHMDDLMALRGKVTLVAGGPPCQGFSMAGKRDKNDQRNKLVKSYIKFIKLVLPQVIIFENVHGFTVNFKGKKGTKQYSSYVERALRRLGYKTMHQIVDMPFSCLKASPAPQVLRMLSVIWSKPTDQCRHPIRRDLWLGYMGRSNQAINA